MHRQHVRQWNLPQPEAAQVDPRRRPRVPGAVERLRDHHAPGVEEEPMADGAQGLGGDRRHAGVASEHAGDRSLFYAWGMVITQSFNGAGDTWTPTWINLGCFWLWEIPLAYVLAVHGELGPFGVALAVTIAFSTVAVVSALLFRRGRWKERRV